MEKEKLQPEEELVLQEPEAEEKFMEIASQREANRCVKQGEGKKRKQVMYARPMFIRDEEGNAKKVRKAEVVRDEESNQLVGKTEQFTAKFSCEESSEELFALEKDEHKVTVFTKECACGAVQKEGLVLFENVKNSADLAYAVLPEGVKEVVRIREKAEEYRYAFRMETENLIPRLSSNAKELYFVSTRTGEEVFEIPTPFMVDDAGDYSERVFYEIVCDEKGNVELCVVADSEWVNAPERVFPVTIDPQILLAGSVSINTFSYDSNSNVLSSTDTHKVGRTNGVMNRMYMALNLPTMPATAKLSKAELTITQSAGVFSGEQRPAMAVYEVLTAFATGDTPVECAPKMLDYVRLTDDVQDGQGLVKYTFNVAELLDQKDRTGTTVYLVFKLVDETIQGTENVTLFGSASGDNSPCLEVEYESNFDVSMNDKTHIHSLGWFGTAGIELQNGNLLLESEDFAWSGNRMPVTVRHMFTGALAGKQFTHNSDVELHTADFSTMKVGQGWRLNVMQSVKQAVFFDKGTVVTGYIYMDETGCEHYLVESDEKCCVTCESGHCCQYYLHKETEDGDLKYDSCKRELYSGNEVYTFDEEGRLIEVKDQYGNKQTIRYEGGQINFILDGAGRKFAFTYVEGCLVKVTAPDETYISYAYTDDLLTQIAYPDGRRTEIAYNAKKMPCGVILKDKDNVPVYKVEYEYSGMSVASVKETGYMNGIPQEGQYTTYEYAVASRSTKVCTLEKDEVEATNAITTTTVYTFDEKGEMKGSYVYTAETGNVSVNGEASGTIHPYAGENGMNVVSNINNLLKNHGFAQDGNWEQEPVNDGSFSVSYKENQNYALFGNRYLRMSSSKAEAVANGVYQETISLPEGDYTFSAYMRPLYNANNRARAYLRVTDTNGTVLAESEYLNKYESDFVRLVAPFSLSESKAVRVHILMNGKFAMHVDGVQLENNQSANAYNLLENGNFELGDAGWDFANKDYACISTEEKFNMSKSMQLNGSVDKECGIQQTVPVKAYSNTKETFTLSGWAKADSVPLVEKVDGRNPSFCLKAIINYIDGEQQVETASFAACTSEWQFASVEVVKERCAAVSSLQVECEYNYNDGFAFFDDIQLIRDLLEKDVPAEDFDASQQESAEENSSESTEDGVTEPGTDESKDAFEEVLDVFGNALTETTFTEGEFGTMYRSFGFNANGNNLIRETDAKGGNTRYIVDAKTSRNKEVIDRCENKTAYEYDVNGRTTKVTNYAPKRNEQDEIVKDENGSTLYDEVTNVSYAYDAFDNMTEIVRGDGLKYDLAYNAFHNLESIGVNGMSAPLVKYTYKNGNGRLKQMTYANGDRMEATYNGMGQMIAETWYDVWGVLVAAYKYVYDGAGNIVQTLDIENGKVYTYTYEKGALHFAREYVATFSGGLVTAKTLVCSIAYRYDSDGKLVQKTITSYGSDGTETEQVIAYENPEEGSPVVKFNAGGKAVTSHSKTDSFGRKVFDELQLSTGFVSRQFDYHVGVVTDTHAENEKLKSTPTTQLVKEILFSDGRTIGYEYDKEERITKVTDSVDGVTEYTYDALGQLLTEAVNGTVVNTMTYDNYGNILSKNGVMYTYGDANWKDLLTQVGDKTITYDAQGNPTSYLGHTLAWEKGRQLRSFDNILYTYNANGIRTSKTVGDVKHTYTLEGAKILQEEWDGNTLIPLYDNEETVCGIIYNGTPYYFVKNLQGDVIALVNQTGTTVARYSYDAWGVCSIAQDSSNCQIATINPYRYRGYYFDEEIGLYYVSSRYYDPEIGRFVNGDEVENTLYTNIVLDYNIFTYVQNNPVVLSDSTGESWITDLLRKAKKGVSSAWNWLKKACSNGGKYFKNTVWKKWIVNGVWKTFCKKWVWEKFCKEMVYNTFIKKWVWQTFCKKWTWQTFCKKWVWQTFCKKWVWKTFCKDWIAKKAWNWVKSAWNSAKSFVNSNPIIGTIVSILGVIIGVIGLFVSATWVAIAGFVIAIIGMLLDIVSKY